MSQSIKTPLLINKVDFNGFVHLSRGLSLDRIEPYILQAIEHDLKPLMCHDFYYDILNNWQEDDYQLLIHGDSYVEDGITKTMNGLKAVIAYFAHARYTLYGNVQDTPFGKVLKDNDYSTPASERSLNQIAADSMKCANDHYLEVVRYLDTKKETFTIYRDCSDCGDTVSSKYSNV